MLFESETEAWTSAGGADSSKKNPKTKRRRTKRQRAARERRIQKALTHADVTGTGAKARLKYLKSPSEVTEAVMREFYRDRLHHGTTGKLVERTDVAKAIGMSEGRRFRERYGAVKNPCEALSPEDVATNPEREPDPEDIITEDHANFFWNEAGNLAFTIDPEASWAEVMAQACEWMSKEGFYPDIWFLSDHGNYHLIDVDCRGLRASNPKRKMPEIPDKGLLLKLPRKLTSKEMKLLRKSQGRRANVAEFFGVSKPKLLVDGRYMIATGGSDKPHPIHLDQLLDATYALVEVGFSEKEMDYADDHITLVGILRGTKDSWVARAARERGIILHEFDKGRMLAVDIGGEYIPRSDFNIGEKYGQPLYPGWDDPMPEKWVKFFKKHGVETDEFPPPRLLNPAARTWADDFISGMAKMQANLRNISRAVNEFVPEIRRVAPSIAPRLVEARSSIDQAATDVGEVLRETRAHVGAGGLRQRPSERPAPKRRRASMAERARARRLPNPPQESSLFAKLAHELDRTNRSLTDLSGVLYDAGQTELPPPLRDSVEEIFWQIDDFSGGLTMLGQELDEVYSGATKAAPARQAPAPRRTSKKSEIAERARARRLGNLEAVENQGYLPDYSMSERAAQARKSGEMPAGDLAKLLKVDVRAIQENLKPSSWHHTSSRYNVTNFYDEPDLLGAARGESSAEAETLELLDLMRAEAKGRKRAAKKVAVETRYAVVAYTEWGGSRKHPTSETIVLKKGSIKLKPGAVMGEIFDKKGVSHGRKKLENLTAIPLPGSDAEKFSNYHHDDPAIDAAEAATGKT